MVSGSDLQHNLNVSILDKNNLHEMQDSPIQNKDNILLSYEDNNMDIPLESPIKTVWPHISRSNPLFEETDVFEADSQVEYENNPSINNTDNSQDNMDNNNNYNEEEVPDQPALGLIMSMNSGYITDSKPDTKNKIQQYKKKNIGISVTSSMDCMYNKYI